ncbi:MAG: MBL fold metallo-hydrolase [Betaproteobacteria bacterium]|nr:MBL fold metallo-hydrolase [Betaproteobacteria bacterium]
MRALDLEGLEVHMISVGPCHRVGDTIVHVPAEGVVFAGDVVFRQCTPMGWHGTSTKWLQALDLILWLDPEVIVPGHGPLCGIEGAMELKAYLEYVREESRRCFAQGPKCPGGRQTDRIRTLSRVAKPGASVRERRERVSGIPQ